MKKIKVTAITVSIAMLFSTMLFGCKTPDDPTNQDDNGQNTEQNSDDNNPEDNNNNGVDDNNQDTPPQGDSALQKLIDAAKDGETITLDTSLSGDVINITKKITVNGNGIENLTINITPDVADNVKLKKFVNATIQVVKGTTSRSAVKARDAAADPVMPKEIGDRNPKLYLEDCSFKKFSTEDDISIYLKDDELKSSIKELELKDGVDSFVIIEDETENLANDKKSAIDKIIIEKGVDEVELLGGYFKDIEFKGEFTAEDKVDFYYDEKGNQVVDAFKEKLAAEYEKVNPKDICNVKNGNGKFKFTIPTAEIDNFNDGIVSIILLKDDQKAALLNQTEAVFPWASVENPYFELTYAGYYKYATEDTDVHAVCGTLTSNYFGAEDISEYYEFYKNYSKEGICSKKTSAGIELYLDLSKVRKSDIATCAFKANGMDDEYYCTPRKLTEIDLKDYKPYIAVIADDYVFKSGKSTTELKALYSFENSEIITLPGSKANGNLGFKQVLFTAMPVTETYPNVAAVEENIWPCADMITFYMVEANTDPYVIGRMPVEQFRNQIIYREQETGYEGYDFFFDAACTHLVWEDLFTETLDKVYLKVIEKVTCYNIEKNGEAKDYRRMDMWLLINHNDDKGIFTIDAPTYENLQTDSSILIKDINDLVPGTTYYWCKIPTQSQSGL